MRTIMLALVLAFSTITMAQNREMKREKLTSEEKVAKQLEKMTSDLSLTNEQQEKLKPILEAQMKKREKKMEEMKEARAKEEKKSKEERAKRREEMKANQDAFKEDMSKILTPEQFENWEKIQESRKEKAKEHLKEKRGRH